MCIMRLTRATRLARVRCNRALFVDGSFFRFFSWPGLFFLSIFNFLFGLHGYGCGLKTWTFLVRILLVFARAKGTDWI